MIIVGIKLSGFDELEKKLKHMERAARKLNGTHQVPLTELFTPSFMRKHTPYSSFDELLDDGGFVVNSSEDFEAIPDEALDKHISNNTNFDSWKGMSEKAASEYALKKLGF